MPLFRKPPQTFTLDLGGFTVEVQLKRIRNLHLRVHARDGSVRISAPWRAHPDDIRAFALSKREWIEKQRRRIQDVEPAVPREYANGESLTLWGSLYRLRVEEHPKPPSVTVEADEIVLRVRAGTPSARREQIIEAWYREQLQAELPALFSRWEPVMGVRSRRIAIQKMKSRWGTCQPSTGTIRLNSELAKKPRECLEYVVVHELAHLIEASHGPRFVAVMDRHIPEWPALRKQLNGRPC